MRYRLLLILLFVCAAFGAHCQSSAAERPNVLFILVDDFGWKDVGYQGSTFYETPELDALAAEWMRFDQCYTPSPMCSPTRVSILTGSHPARHGVTQWLDGTDKAFIAKGETASVYCPRPLSSGIQDSEITLGERLHDAGYATAFYGKWHMGRFKNTGGPKNHGYSEQLAVIESNGCRMDYPFSGGKKAAPAYFPDAQPGDNFTDLLTDAAIDFVATERDSPFYLHLCYFSMHSPLKSKSVYREKFAKKAASLPALETDRITDPYTHLPQSLRQDEPEYAGQLYNLDRNIGLLIDALKDEGLYENTIIILTGDNGGRSAYFRSPPTSNRPLRNGKTFLFEGGIRTPLLIHWPQYSQPGRRSETPVMSTDFYPTILDMLDLPETPDQPVDGVSLVPLFQGKALDRDTLYWHFPHYQGEGAYPASAIRVGSMKLIQHYHHDTQLLFDLSQDQGETYDLSADRPDIATKMADQLRNYLTTHGATIPEPR